LSIQKISSVCFCETKILYLLEEIMKELDLSSRTYSKFCNFVKTIVKASEKVKFTMHVYEVLIRLICIRTTSIRRCPALFSLGNRKRKRFRNNIEISNEMFTSKWILKVHFKIGISFIYINKKYFQRKFIVFLKGISKQLSKISFIMNWKK
jgi:hypothetical protein